MALGVVCFVGVSFYMEGWIKLHRKLIEWEWYSDQNAKALFIHCLLKANIKDKIWRGIKIKEGQFFTSLANLAFDLDLSVKQIRIAMQKLESTGDIKHEGASKGTLLIVCNYICYQGNSKLKGQAKGQARGKQGATTKEERERKEEILKQKQLDFKIEVEGFAERYSSDMLTAFYVYWSEPNQAKTKTRKEMQPTWDTARRLVTWYNRSKK